MERIEKYYEEIVKIVKDLTFSYVDKQGELWDDRKKEWEKIWLLNWMTLLGRKSSWR